MPIRLHIDSTAALSIISKTGLGKAKHVEIQHLWLQAAVRNNRLKEKRAEVGEGRNPPTASGQRVHASPGQPCASCVTTT